MSVRSCRLADMSRSGSVARDANGVDFARLGEVAATSPTLTLLAAYSRDWVLPLFAEHLEEVGSVAAEWFHERVADALRTARLEKDWQGDRTPAEHCAVWVKNRWLETEMADSGVRYRLSAHALRAIRFVREVADEESTVSGARLALIADQVRRLADLTSLDHEAQAQRIQAEIEALQHRRDEVLAGRVAPATESQMHEQLREVLSALRTLPADFRQLRSMVEERHKSIARESMVRTPKADMVESFVRENDLLDGTQEGQAYRRFARMLASSQESAAIQRDLDVILATQFATEQMTARQRAALQQMFATLMGAELEVQEAYVRWTASLRRVLTRVAHGRFGRLLSLASAALEAGSEWVEKDPVSRGRDLDDAVLGVGAFAACDVSQLQLWREEEESSVVVAVAGQAGPLPASDRAALRLAAGTSPKAVAARVNALVAERGIVTAEEVFDSIPAEFQRLGALVAMLDLASAHGVIDADLTEKVLLAGGRERQLQVLLPLLWFEQPIPDRAEARR